MAILSQELGLLFIQTPHTGSTAVARLLIRRSGGVRLPTKDQRKLNPPSVVPHHHATLRQLMDGGVVTRDQRGGLIVAAGARNPFDLLVSEYVRTTSATQTRSDGSVIRKAAAPAEFPAWLRWRLRPRWQRRLRGKRYAALRDHTDGADEVVRFEHLQEDFDALMKRVGSVPMEVAVINATVGRQRDRRHYSAFYGPDERKAVESVYAAWLDRFGYGFEAG